MSSRAHTVAAAFVILVASACSPSASEEPPMHYGEGGGISWLRAMGGAGGECPVDVTVDGLGDVLLLDNLIATIDFGGGLERADGERDAVLAKYSSGGEYRWLLRFAGAYWNVLTNVAADVEARVLVAGAAFDGEDITGFGEISPSGSLTGTPELFDVCPVGRADFAFDADGNLVTTGSTTEDPACDPDAEPWRDISVAKFGPDYELLWHERLGGPGIDRGERIATDPDGSIYVVGSFHDALAIGETSLSAVGEADIALFKFASNGELMWAKGLGTAEADEPGGLAVDGLGNAFVLGRFEVVTDLESGQSSNVGVADVIAFASDGTYLWSADFAGTKGLDIWNIAAGNAGGVIVAGSFSDIVDLGGGPLERRGYGADIVIVRLSPRGEHIWSQQIPYEGYNACRGLAVGPVGSAVLTATFSEIEIGGESIACKGPADFFLLKLEP